MFGRASGMAVLLAGAIAPSALSAQDNPDCRDPQTQTAMNICAGLDYEAADADLNAAYKEAIAAMKRTDADLPPDLKGAEKALREAQRGWLVYRDKTCEVTGFMARGGSMESMLAGQCLASTTRNRTQELKELSGGLVN